MARMCMIGLAVLFSFQLAGAKDFRKNYTLAPGGQVFIENVLGDIKVKGFKGDSIEIVGNKKGDGSDQIEILDTSAGNRIDIRIRPTRSSREAMHASISKSACPKSIEYNFTRIFSFSGNVHIAGVAGRLRAESVRGNVALKDVKGLVSAIVLQRKYQRGHREDPGSRQYEVFFDQREY